MASKKDEQASQVADPIVDSETVQAAPESPVEPVLKVRGTGQKVFEQLHLLHGVKLATVGINPLRNQHNNKLYTQHTPLDVNDINAPEAKYERDHIQAGLFNVVDHD